MYSQKDILAALQNGEDPQAIANGFADALNAAIKQKAEADKKAAEAKAAQEKAAAAQAEKEKIAEVIYADIMDFIEEYYPDLYDEEMRTVSGKDLTDAFEQARIEIVKIKPVFNDLENLVNQIEEAQKKNLKDNKNLKKIDPITKFLRDNGLLF